MSYTSSRFQKPKLNPIKWVYINFVSAVSWLFQVVLFPQSHRLEVTNINIKCQNFSKLINHHNSSISNLKIVQLTDIHWDWPNFPTRTSHKLLQQVIDETNRQKPDLIVLTGDYVQRHSGPISDLVTKYLSNLKAKYGVYATLGNHDHKDSPEGTELIKQTLRQAGIHLLDNQSAVPIPFLSRLHLVGLGDLKSPNDWRPQEAFTLKPNQEEPIYRIVLSHNPDSASNLRKYRVHLQLSGHSHGTQVILPYIGPAIPAFLKLLKHLPKVSRKRVPGAGYTKTMTNWDWAAGLHSIPNQFGEHNLLYTSRGIATHPPTRIGCPPELTVIHIEASPN